MWLVVINIFKDFINIVYMFQLPLLINGHRFLNLSLIFYIQIFDNLIRNKVFRL